MEEISRHDLEQAAALTRKQIEHSTKYLCVGTGLLVLGVVIYTLYSDGSSTIGQEISLIDKIALCFGSAGILVGSLGLVKLFKTA